MALPRLVSDYRAVDSLEERLRLESGYKVDLVGFDQGGDIVLIGEVKYSPLTRTEPYLRQLEEIAFQTVPQSKQTFLLIADTEAITIYSFSAFKQQSESVAVIPTGEIRQRYPPSSQSPVSQSRLLSVLRAWLSDVILQWKFPNPPALELLEKVGLRDRLHNGQIETELTLVS